MKLTLLFISLVFIANSSAKLDLEYINRQLTRIVDTEIQQVVTCWKKVLKCENGKKYPDCLDTKDGEVTIDHADIDVEQFFIIDIFNMMLTGNMVLDNTKFHGFSDFELTHVESSVTVVPLGIEFKCTLVWNGEINFNSEYDLGGITYRKYNKNQQMSGKSDDEEMKIHFKSLSYSLVAHKILGGKMDYLKITPNVDEFSVFFPEIKLDAKDVKSILEKKFNKKFIIDGIDYKKMSDYAMKFFNDSLYPDARKTRAIENPLLKKLGTCIKDYFPE